MDDTLTIGEVARRAGLTTSAIRYYESIGYKGLYTIEVTGPQPMRKVYDWILENV